MSGTTITSDSKVSPASSRYGATQDDWMNLDLNLRLTQDLLPVVSNQNSSVSPKSSLKQIGKVPSKYNNARQIIGIANWTQHKTTSGEITQWMREPDYGICIQTRCVRAFDIDVTGPNALKISEWIRHSHMRVVGLRLPKSIKFVCDSDKVIRYRHNVFSRYICRSLTKNLRI